MDFKLYLNEHNSIRVLVKPNAVKTEILDYDIDKKAFRISIKAIPDKGKANKELLKFLFKKTKKKFKIASGSKSRLKLLKVVE